MSHTAYVNGSAHKCYVGKHDIYILCKIAEGYSKWFTVSELEKFGCKVVIK